MKRKFYHYEKWEDYKNGMFSSTNKIEREDQIKQAISILSNKKLCFKSMLKVINSWPIACEHNLTNLEQNRKAWLGQAACNIELKINEENTRLSWVRLTDEQRKKANSIADIVIKEWERKYEKKLFK